MGDEPLLDGDPAGAPPTRHTEWVCGHGHTYSSDIPVLEVMCGRCRLAGLKGDIMMKPVRP